MKKFIDFEGTHSTLRHVEVYQQTLEFILLAIAQNHGLLTPEGVKNSPISAMHKSPKGMMSSSVCIIDFPESPSLENIPIFKHIHTPRRSPYSLTLRPLTSINNKDHK